MPRPPYKPSEEHLQTAYRGAKAGLSQLQIAKAIGISKTTLARHKDEFMASLKRGHDELEAIDPYLENVEDALRKRALGFDSKEVKTTEELYYPTPDPKTPDEIPDPILRASKVITTEKTIAPDTTAIIFYLVNRSDGRWRSIHTPDALLGHQVDTEEILKAQAERDGYNIE